MASWTATGPDEVGQDGAGSGMTRPPYEVFVFVRRAEEFLILHRSERQGAYWHCVAGGVEERETYAEAAARELHEETGLVAEPVDLARPYDYALEEWEARYERGADSIHVECFLVDAPAGWEPRLDWEHDDYRWCSVDEAAELLFWPEPREVLQELAAR
jgi:8-oxo-dGTP pyrophosphatase MutT (NUDIX family)